jgi:hypothetical protein
LRALFPVAMVNSAQSLTTKGSIVAFVNIFPPQAEMLVAIWQY